jgi:hypothetical protein
MLAVSSSSPSSSCKATVYLLLCQRTFRFLKKQLCPQCYLNRPVLIIHSRYSLVRSFGKSPTRHSVQVYRYLTLAVATNLVIRLTRSTRAVPKKKPGYLHVCAR